MEVLRRHQLLTGRSVTHGQLLEAAAVEDGVPLVDQGLEVDVVRGTHQVADVAAPFGHPGKVGSLVGHLPEVDLPAVLVAAVAGALALQAVVALDESGDFHGIVGRSAAMQRVFDVTERVAGSEAPVITSGQSGTGKELVAHAIHRIGPRREHPFVQLNCAALNDALLESELFGHTRGAFTGAYRHRTGRFEAADSGDIFLDEIGDVPLPVQVKLLRVLETGQFDRVGDHRPVRVDVRVISATNKNLLELVARKQFREDLFFRINVIPIHLPPLRERREDIPILVNRFIQNLRKETAKPISALAPDVLRLFMDYGWPGNARELKSTLAYAFVIADAGQVKREHLPPQFTPGFGGAGGGLGEGRVAGEKAALLEALRQTGGNQTQAARLLGINRVTVWHRMRKYGIDLKGDLKRGRFAG